MRVRNTTCAQCGKLFTINEPGFIAYFDEPLCAWTLFAHYLTIHRRWVFGFISSVKMFAALLLMAVALVTYGILWAVTWPFWKMHDYLDCQ
jgi:hypothetical protein